MDITITLLLVAALFLILGCGVWVGLTLTGVAWIGMRRPSPYGPPVQPVFTSHTDEPWRSSFSPSICA